MEGEPRKENEFTCSYCGHPIDRKDPDVGWIEAKGHHYHLDHYKPQRPRWQIVDKDDGIVFARKDYSEDRVKHMDIMEGNDEDRKHYKSIIIYETGNEENPVLLRNSNARKK